MEPLKPSPEECETICEQAFLVAREELSKEDVTVEFLEYSEEEENDYGQTLYPFTVRYNIDANPSPSPSQGFDTGKIGNGLYVEATSGRTNERDVATFVVLDMSPEDEGRNDRFEFEDN
ncbi:hypothetical protein B4589_004710 [Halolamina sp. CBA1230]|uniref:hypothetical protein n=1 Tax=Halolamina sp. CBA1230 TaxID=1853690 RepID=UPI00117B1301|nr:hypothetical protein [Halolamina sp. CBA1230]QKY19714.1 hypothetical protein B4589_004710 [Halolamina sp. CBA1230]